MSQNAHGHASIEGFSEDHSLNSKHLSNQPIALFTNDGKHWIHPKREPFSWNTYVEKPEYEIKKIVIGNLDFGNENNRPEVKIPDDFAICFPAVTHLYLWRIKDLEAIPELPLSLECLDIRGCEQLNRIQSLPSNLKTLVIEDCPLARVTGNYHDQFSQLTDASFRGCPKISPAFFEAVQSNASCMRRIDLSDCPQLASIASWPSSLERIELNLCEGLTSLAATWPPNLKRLGLRESNRVESLPASFPEKLQYLDLCGTRSLQELPRIPAGLRTLILFGSGVNLPASLFGENCSTNVAGPVQAYLNELDRDSNLNLESPVDDEIKVILLGESRCGKTSLARRLVDDRFDETEDSTHGIQLWETKINIPSIDSQSGPKEATLHIWDFAGQDIYHNTHRLFLQSDAIFLICQTFHGDGHDLKSDAESQNPEFESDDFRRNLNYWQEFVASLGDAPGTNKPPPVLIVNTKYDRDSEPGSATQTKALPGSVNLSAKNPNIGFDQLRQWLSSEIAKILSPSQRKKLGTRPMAVKRFLQRIKDRNQRAITESQKKGYRIAPPRPCIPRTYFDRLVIKICGCGHYAENPSLLLDFFHKSGFVYFNELQMPNQIILDQRWSIEGIYTVFHRQRCWQQLKDRRGRFTASDLGNWAWNEQGYNSDEQAIFLEFMKACDICFTLLTRQDSGKPETCYLTPSALRRADEVQREAEDHRLGIAKTGESIVLEDSSLSRSSITQLLIQLGQKWRRAPLFWRWGAQFQSYRQGDWITSLTFVHLDWQPRAEDSYGGKLTFTQYGPDHSFLRAILKQCRDLIGFHGVRRDIESKLSVLEKLDVPDDTSPSPSRGHRALFDPDTIDAHSPTEPQATAVEISISFAGDGQDPNLRWEELPDDSIEKWPRALATTLRRMQFKVDEYRSEQQRNYANRASDRAKFLNFLMSRDYIIVFLSWKYYESEWCMYEFMKVLERMPPDGTLDTNQARLATFSEAIFSQSVHAGEVAQRQRRFKIYWETKLDEFAKRLKRDIQSDSNRKLWQPMDLICKLLPNAISAPLRRISTPTISDREIYSKYVCSDEFAHKPWMDLVANKQRFEGLIKKLQNWSIERIALTPTPDELTKWTEEIAQFTKSSKVLVYFAKRALHANQHTRAIQLYLEAISSETDPDRKQDLLTSVSDNDLNFLRKMAQG